MSKFHIVYKLKGNTKPVNTITHEGVVITNTSLNHGVTVKSDNMMLALESFYKIANKGITPETCDITLIYKVDDHGRLDT